MQACDRCHRRKSRCDKIKPQCGVCKKQGVECSYVDRSRDPATRKEHVEGIERRLRQEEAKNQALSKEIARLRLLETSRVREASHTPRDGIQIPNIQEPSPGDLISEVSFLASTAAGEQHYLGSASGVLFADLVRASVDITPKIQDSSSATAIHGSIRIPFHQQPYSNCKDALPPRAIAQELFENYFAHDHLCYPFLVPATTFPIIESIYSDPGFYKRNKFEAFVFDMILAIATGNVYKSDWQMLPSAETHHARAMHCATEIFQLGGLRSLQAILLLCQYRTSSSIQDTSASMWQLVGIATRIAFELGLHRETAYTINQPANEEQVAEFQAQESKRRCFWSVFCMDRIVAITLGRPVGVHLEDIDVELPLAENDQFINSEIESPLSSDFNRTCIFIHVVKYRLLCGKITRSLHGPKKTGHNETEVYSLRDKILAELTDWHRDTQKLEISGLSLSALASQTRSSFLSEEWYGVLYHNAILMLFRPCPMISDTRDSATLQKLFASSKQAILLYASLHRSRKINYSWITLHSVFMAGLTYLYALSRHFRERRKLSSGGAVLAQDPTAIEIVNNTRACSNVLVAVSERWNSLRNCHEVFDKLSDAVLSDAIKLQCSRPTSRERTPFIPPPSNGTPSAALATQTNFHNDNPSVSETSWTSNPEAATNSNFHSGTSPLAIDSEFRNCFGDLQNLYSYSAPFVGDPVMELSQDWLGYIDGFDIVQDSRSQQAYHGLQI